MIFRLLDTGTASAEENMRLDHQLLLGLHPDDVPVIHLYDWKEPSLTYGYFTSPQELLNLQEIEYKGFKLAKRPTGGGIIFHTCDLAFSLLIPANHPTFSLNTLENYATINKKVAQAIHCFLKGKKQPELVIDDLPQQRPTFCMAKPTIYDILLDGRKVGGAAQRRTKEGLLHQGSISLTFPDNLEKLTVTAQEIRKNTYPLLGETVSKSQLKRSRQLLKHYLIQTLSK